MEVPGLGIELELQLQAYAIAIATPDPCSIFDLCCSVQQHLILNPVRGGQGLNPRPSSHPGRGLKTPDPYLAASNKGTPKVMFVQKDW